MIKQKKSASLLRTVTREDSLYLSPGKKQLRDEFYHAEAASCQEELMKQHTLLDSIEVNQQAELSEQQMLKREFICCFDCHKESELGGYRFALVQICPGCRRIEERRVNRNRGERRWKQ